MAGQIHLDRTDPIALDETLAVDSANMSMIHAGALAGVGVRSNVSIGYQDLLKEQKTLQDEQNELGDSEKISAINNRLRAINEQLSLLKEYEKSPFLDIVAMPETNEPERITNPFSIITGFSTIRQLQEQKIEQKSKIENLNKF